MKNLFNYKMASLAFTFFVLTACGGPAIIDPNKLVDPSAEVTDGSLPNGVGNFTVTSDSSQLTFSINDIKTNIHYDAAADTLSVSVFGNDTTGSVNGTLYFILRDISLMPEGSPLTVAELAVSGSLGERDPASNSANPTSVFTIDGGSVTPTTICLDANACTNTGSFSLTYTSGTDAAGTPVVYTITGNYTSPSLYLD